MSVHREVARHMPEFRMCDSAARAGSEITMKRIGPPLLPKTDHPTIKLVRSSPALADFESPTSIP
jgi:hypothetical protein